MKLTRKKALEITFRTWVDLANHPEKNSKTEASNYNELKPLTNLCACCEYVFQHQDSKGLSLACADVGGLGGQYDKLAQSQLKLCPLKALWPKGCESGGSPYWEWVNRDSMRAECARRIADAAKVELEKLR